MNVFIREVIFYFLFYQKYDMDLRQLVLSPGKRSRYYLIMVMLIDSNEVCNIYDELKDL